MSIQENHILLFFQDGDGHEGAGRVDRKTGRGHAGESEGK